MATAALSLMRTEIDLAAKIMVFFYNWPFRRALPAFLMLIAILAVAMPAAAERVHVVAQGHTLGKIAKRYHTSVEALCEANKIRRRDPLKVGQRIVIPDPEGAKPKAKPDARTERHASPSKHRPKDDANDSEQEQDVYTTHVVARGHTLGKIARRFRTTVDAIRSANGLQPRQPLTVGVCLVVPLTSRSTERQRTRQLPCVPDKVDPKTVDKARRPPDVYARRPKRSGVVHLVRGGRTFRGRILNRRGQPIEASVAKVNELLFDRRTAKTHSTDVGLLEKIVQVSDHFGGRKILIVSGYREEGSSPYTPRSNHALGKAMDFRIDGVPNDALRDFCHTLSGVGVGYYPNSSFIHLDVRSITTHWTDVSGPGEAPRYTSVRAPKK